jgi:hypothetical protein
LHEQGYAPVEGKEINGETINGKLKRSTGITSIISDLKQQQKRKL